MMKYPAETLFLSSTTPLHAKLNWLANSFNENSDDKSKPELIVKKKSWTSPRFNENPGKKS